MTLSLCFAISRDLYGHFERRFLNYKVGTESSNVCKTWNKHKHIYFFNHHCICWWPILDQRHFQAVYSLLNIISHPPWTWIFAKCQPTWYDAQCWVHYVDEIRGNWTWQMWSLPRMYKAGFNGALRNSTHDFPAFNLKLIEYKQCLWLHLFESLASAIFRYM